MSETMTAKAYEHKEHKEKDKEPKVKDKNQSGDDPYCCTPPGGDTGPDTKP